MCIIIIQPEGHVFGEDAIIDFAERNPHGFGFMWIDEQRGLQGIRTVFDSENLWEEAIAAYNEYAAGKAGVLHYRFATSGPVDKTMAHPWAVSKQLLVVHNGVLPGGSNKESDTCQFVREVLRPLFGGKNGYKKLLDPTSQVMLWLEAYVKGNSLVFLDVDGNITRVGSKGVVYDGCWYSNTYAWTLPKELGGRGLAAEYGGFYDFDDDDDAWWYECECVFPEVYLDDAVSICRVCGGRCADYVTDPRVR